MILQTCRHLDANVRENGCYFMAILYHAGQKNRRSFTTDDILRLKEKAITQGYLRRNCFVDNPDGIFRLAGLRTQYTQRHEPPNRQAEPNELEILYYRWGEYGHFVAGVSGVIAYDPLGCSKAVQFGTLRSKRIFKIKTVQR